MPVKKSAKISVVFSIILAFIWQSLFFGSSYSLTIPLLFIPGIILFCVAFLFTIKTRNFLLRYATFCLVAGIAIPFFVYVRTLFQIYTAKYYLENQVAVLEEFKAKNNRYPNNISELKISASYVPYLIANHLGFSSCTIPHVDEDPRWYCALDNANNYELSFGYEEELNDERPSYSMTNKTKVWECSGIGCLTDHD